MSVKNLIDEKVCNKIKNAIAEYNGGEIFFGCILNENGDIIDVEPVCHGNDEAVLAPYELVNRYNAILHNHPTGNVKPSEADLEQAYYFQQEGIGFFITDNEASTINVVVPPIQTRKKKKLDADFIGEYFAAGGGINKIKDDFEYRAGQQKMAVEVASAINDDKIAVIEAGTGIGKSLAYLIPAFLWVEQNKERIVISTNTINLQSQLLNKDIPIVKKILNSPIEAVVVKGRRNYLCKLKLYNMSNELEFDEDSAELNSILKWANTTQDGVIDELNFVPNSSTWEKVSSDVDFCIGRHCIFYKDCFFQQARRHASESNILIVNHHILFADINIRGLGRGIDDNTLLPPYRKIVIDEAHNILASASSFFSTSFSKSGFYKFMGLLMKNNKGFLPWIYKKLIAKNAAEIQEIAKYINEEVMAVHSFVYQSSFDIFNNISIYLQKIIENANNKYENGSKLSIQYRIKKEQWESDEFTKLFIYQLKDLLLKIEELEKAFDFIQMKFEKVPDKLKSKFDVELKLVKSYQNKITTFQQNLNFLLDIEPGEYVTWFEIFGDADDPNFKFIATPLYIDKMMYNNVYQVFDSIIFTSATLTVNKNFEFFKNIVGINLCKEKEVLTDSINSPFNYQKHVLLAVPDDTPEPNNYDYNKHINEFLKNSILATKGSSFVLFTSYAQLKKSFNEVEPFLQENGLRCLFQGEMEKSKLLDKFIIDESSNLFATSSFWEGVDAPGKTLRYVILAKLPFSIPTEPIEEARIEDMEKRGINAFMTYSLPSAIIRLKQGFGRLIRKKDDYGVVTILDSRVLKKFYGRMFIDSLPQCKFISSSSEKIIDEIKMHIDEFE